MVNHKIYRGDSLEILNNVEDESIDLIFSDPPFNENYIYRNSTFIDYRDDYYFFLSDVFKECKRILKRKGSIYIKHSSRQISELIPLMNKYFKFRNLIVWISNSLAHPKQNYDSYFEPIYFYTSTDDFTFHKREEYRKKPPNYWSGEGKEFIGLLCNCWYDIKKVQAGCLSKVEGGKVKNLKMFSCSMPIRLPERAIKISSNENDVVLDMFVGSGTTLIAAERNNRNSIGIDIEKNNCVLSYRNLLKEVNQSKFNRKKSKIECIGF